MAVSKSVAAIVPTPPILTLSAYSIPILASESWFNFTCFRRAPFLPITPTSPSAIVMVPVLSALVVILPFTPLLDTKLPSALNNTSPVSRSLAVTLALALATSIVLALAARITLSPAPLNFNLVSRLVAPIAPVTAPLPKNSNVPAGAILLSTSPVIVLPSASCNTPSLPAKSTLPVIPLFAVNVPLVPKITLPFNPKSNILFNVT